MNSIIPYFLIVRGANPRDTYRARFQDVHSLEDAWHCVLAWIDLYGYPTEIKIERMEK